MIIRNLIRAFQKNIALQFSTWLVLSLCCLLMAGALLLSFNLQNILTFWGDSIQVTVYLQDTVSAEQIQQFEQTLKADRRIGQFEYKNKKDSLREFQKQISQYAPEMANQADILSIIPASYMVSLSTSVMKENSVKTLRNLADELKKFEFVEDVSYGQDWVKNYSQFTTAIQSVSGSVLFVLVLAFLLVMGNVIRQSVYSRREEIEVYELLGAQYYKIRMPFIIEGFVLAGIAALTGLGLSWLVYEWVGNYVRTQLGFIGLDQALGFLSFEVALMFIVSVSFLGALGSYFCIGRMNSGWSSRQRLQS